MKLLKLLLTPALIVSMSCVMAQTSESSDKTTGTQATKPAQTTSTTIQKKETKSPTATVNSQTGTYQKAVKQTATSSKKTATQRKPKTKKERLEMEAAAKAQAQTATASAGTFKPGPDGYIEVSKNDLQLLVDKMGDGKLKIKSFTMVYTQNGTTKKLLNTGTEVSDEIRKTVETFPTGQTFSIEDGKGYSRNGREIALPSSKFRIKPTTAEVSTTLKKK